MSSASPALDRIRDLFKAAAGGLLTGMLTPLMHLAVDFIWRGHAEYRIGLMALPFAALVLALVRISGHRWWIAAAAALVTILAFIGAVNVAIFVDAHAFDLGKYARDALAGLAGGFVGSGIMLLFIGVLVWSPVVLPWLPMLVFGTVAGSLLAADNTLDLTFDMATLSILFPVWQCGVAAGLMLALQRSRH